MKQFKLIIIIYKHSRTLENGKGLRRSLTWARITVEVEVMKSIFVNVNFQTSTLIGNDIHTNQT